MIYEVYKRFSGPGTTMFAPGDLVETSAWRNERNLIRSGYLGPPRKTKEELAKVNISVSDVAASMEVPEHVKRPSPSAGTPKLALQGKIPVVVPNKKLE